MLRVTISCLLSSVLLKSEEALSTPTTSVQVPAGNGFVLGVQQGNGNIFGAVSGSTGGVTGSINLNSGRASLGGTLSLGKLGSVNVAANSQGAASASIGIGGASGRLTAGINNVGGSLSSSLIGIGSNLGSSGMKALNNALSPLANFELDFLWEQTADFDFLTDFNPFGILKSLNLYSSNSTLSSIISTASSVVSSAFHGITSMMPGTEAAQETARDIVSNMHIDLMNAIFGTPLPLPDISKIMVVPQGFSFEQADASDKWVIPGGDNNLMNNDAVVNVYDSDGFKIAEDEVYIDSDNNMVITFTAPVSGKAVVSSILPPKDAIKAPIDKAVDELKAQQKLRDEQETVTDTSKQTGGGKVDTSRLDIRDTATMTLVSAMEATSRYAE